MTITHTLKSMQLLTCGLVLGAGFAYALSFAAAPLATHAQTSNDGIAVRTMKNDNHVSSLQWYYENVPAERQGSPAQTAVDGYPAVRDGRSVYVNAGNVSGGTLYTNIYILSHTQNAQSETVDIFGQLLKNWTFNVNLVKSPGAGACLERASGAATTPARSCYTDAQCGTASLYCDSAKAKVTRDVIRLGHHAAMQAALTAYKAANGDTVPQLSAGTYVQGKSISVWPSWQQTLGSVLGITMPVDPLNVLWNCTSPGNDGTCWDEANQSLTDGLSIPVGNYGYVYSYSAAYGLFVRLETSYTIVGSAGGSELALPPAEGDK